MSEAMPSERFTNLVMHVAELARGGTLLTKEVYQQVIDSLAEQEGSLRSIAQAVRQLGSFCDWSEFRWADEFLRAAGCQDQVHLEIQRINEERESYYKGPRFNQTVEKIAQGLKESQEDQRRLMQAMRDVETLMGFDQEVTNQLFATLGDWDDSAVPASLLELLPEDLVFSLKRTRRASLYDHRLHLLVRELVTRLGDKNVNEDEVIQECGHVLAELIHSDDEEAASKLVQKQVTLRAEAYVKEKPWDTLGLCWRGELACWAWDWELIEEYGGRIWERVRRSSAKEINDVTAFFALTTDSAEEWSNWGWDRLGSPRSHLGEIEVASIDVERPLALAVVRNAMQRGVWDTSLLCSTFQLRESGYILDADDLPVECWVWMAENIQHSGVGNEMHYEYWNNAFRLLGSGTDPRLTHNVLAVLLTALLFNKSQYYELPPIHEVLEGLTNTLRADSTAHKRRAALEMVRYVLDKINPDHLTAADRLTMTKAIAGLRQPSQNRDISSQGTEAGEGSEQITPVLLDQAEVRLRSQMGEKHWARLSPRAKDEFKHGEFDYILASKQEGEGGNFDSFVFHYSKGLLVDIQMCLLAPTKADRSLIQEHDAVIGRTPEWNELLSLIRDPGRVTVTRYGKKLLAQRVDLRGLSELEDFFERMKSLRNRASHSGRRISRHDATLLHELLFRSGMIQKTIELFPKPPPR
jgi:hypothetical protein